MTRRSDLASSEEAFPGYVIAGLGPIAVGASLVAVRSEIEHTTAVLILVVVVILAAITGGRLAGAIAAVMATVSFDFFLTRPYLSLRIDGSADVQTTIVLLVIGLLVGQIVVRARRSRAVAERASEEVRRLERMAGMAAELGDTRDLVHALEAELIGLLGLRECAYVPDAPPAAMRRIERSGAVPGARHVVGRSGDFELPPEGAALVVSGGGHAFGHFALDPTPGLGVSLEARVAAVALADQLGVVLAAERER